MTSVLYFENQETWLQEEMRRTWQFRSVYLTISSGVQQRANTLKQEKGIPRFMSSMKHFRNFAPSEVKFFFKLSLSTNFRFFVCGCIEKVLYSGHLIGCRKSGKLCGNFRQYYAEVSDDYTEKTPNYAEICKIN